MSGIILPCVTDHLVLSTIAGAADLLAEDLRAMASVRSVRQTSPHTVECVVDGPLDELAACPLYSTAAVRDLQRSLRSGVLSCLEPPVKFRVGDRDPVRRRAMIADFEQRCGWLNRPGEWDVNLERSADGWVVQYGPLAWPRRFGSLRRLPWSTNLIAAEVLVRLAKIRPHQTVLDPFCGTGTILLAARRREPTVRLLGADHDPHALALAGYNTKPWVPNVVRAEAGSLPVADGSVDRVVANLPFGKQVGSHRSNRGLYPGVLREIDRVLAPAGRVVLLTEDKRLLRRVVERQRGLKVVRERLLRYGGASPTAYVLTRLGRSAESR
ncbi:methyltransferase domain-containing protein [Kribbella sp. HUAS MG21]|uniref:Methyltransferase domain-containing protein n=1 Tax=Kribbella sp. HUAS MG21 TaxID=3160966 RepID=A0AAU7THP6_9ACTN